MAKVICVRKQNLNKLGYSSLEQWLENPNHLHSVPYTPSTNPVEMWFNQLKHYLKLNKKVLRYRV